MKLRIAGLIPARNPASPGVLLRHQNLLTWATLTACLVASIYVIYYASGYEHSNVNTNFFVYFMPSLAPNSASLGWHDLVLPFYKVGTESRPRFLNWFVEILDHHLRFFLYRFVLIPPTLSVAWIGQLIIAPCCLYRLMMNLVRNRQAAVLALAVYISSVGFIYGISTLNLAAKPLSNVIYIVVLYLASRLDARGARGKLLFAIPGAEKHLMLFVLFLGGFLDELPLFAYALPALVFPRRFLPRPWAYRKVRAAAVNLGLLAAPFVAFVLFTIFVAPMITAHFFNYRFDYIGTLLAYNEGPDKPMFGVFSLHTLFLTILSLIGTSLVPLQAGLPAWRWFAAANMSAAEALLYSAFVSVLVIIFVAIYRGCANGYYRSLIAKFGLTIAVFLVFFSMLMGRLGLAWSTGFYYGTVFSVLFALMFGVSFAAIDRNWGRARTAFLALTVVVAAVQLNNLIGLQQAWVDDIDGGTAEDLRIMGNADAIMLPPLTIDEHRPVDRAVLAAYWQAWREHRLDASVRNKSVPVDAIYLIAELNYLDHLRALHQP